MSYQNTSNKRKREPEERMPTEKGLHQWCLFLHLKYKDYFIRLVLIGILMGKKWHFDTSASFSVALRSVQRYYLPILCLVKSGAYEEIDFVLQSDYLLHLG